MRTIVVKCITDRFQSFIDILDSLEENALTQKLPITKNKSLVEHFWCLLGGRESYIKAIHAGEWQGFNCSLQQYDIESIRALNRKTITEFETTISQIETWEEARCKYLADLMEHEVMHEGQIIRQLYGLELEIPKSVRWA